MCAKLTLQDVIREIELANQRRDLSHELTPANREFFSRRNGTFEAVLTGNGDEKCLIPETGSVHYLYRGQNQEYIPCVPTIYRGHPSELDIFINRMRLMVFQELLDSHPVVQHFFKKHHFLIDYEGLAQHYGLKTEVLDLTSKLNVAIFFAVCKYDEINNCYKYFNDNELHKAILYVFDPIRDNEPCPSSHFENYMQGNIKPIGLQAFQRPGAQFGYSLHISRGKSIKCWMYEFSFTSEDSKYYYDLFHQGEQLWVKDILINKVKAISSLKEFSYRVFGETYRKYKPKRYSRNSLQKSLNSIGITFNSGSSDIIFTDDEVKAIIDDWNTVIAPELSQKIVRKYWFECDGVDDKCHIIGMKNRSDYRTLESISTVKYQEFIADPDGPKNALWRNYTNLPRPKEAPRTDDNEWHKIDERFVSEFGKPFLTENDWIIK